MANTPAHLATDCIHGGQHPEATTGAVMPPIFTSSTFIQESPGVHKGFEYSRSHNATRFAFERCVANLESSGLSEEEVRAIAMHEHIPEIAATELGNYLMTSPDGETCIRGNIMPGDGVYKSADAGKTWANVGFKNVDAISKIRIHPTNPDIVYVATNAGVFKTINGGDLWTPVHAGHATDLVLRPRHVQIVAFADRIAAKLGESLSPDETLVLHELPLAFALGLDEAVLAEVMETVHRESESAKSAL